MSSASDEARSAELRQEAEGIREDLQRLIREIEKVIVGHHEVIEGILICLLCGGHVAAGGRARPRQDPPGEEPGAGAQSALLADSIHSRPDARGYHRHQRRDGR